MPGRRSARPVAGGVRPSPAIALDPEVAERLADVMHALSTPSRVQILGCLASGPASVGEITEAIGMEQSAVSHQLRVLREHELVRAERSGRMRLYRLFDDHVTELLEAAVGHVAERAAGRGRRLSASGA